MTEIHDLRIYKTYTWVPVVTSVGGKFEMKLVSNDELQYQASNGEWLPVEVVKAKIPPMPEIGMVAEDELNKLLNREFNERVINELHTPG